MATTSQPQPLRPPRGSVKQHPLSLAEQLDINGKRCYMHPNYSLSQVRTNSPVPTPNEIARRQIELQKLRIRLQQLPGFAKEHEMLEIEEGRYEPCDWHRRWPPSCNRPDLKALGMQFKYQEGSFHGGLVECCDWRRHRTYSLTELLNEAEREQMKGKKKGMGGDEEKDAEKPEGDGSRVLKRGKDVGPDVEEYAEKESDGLEEDAYNENAEVEMLDGLDEPVTYFTFLTPFPRPIEPICRFVSNAYYAEASWPEIMDAARRREERSWMPPYGRFQTWKEIWRVVGNSLKRRYVAEEIESGEMVSEETSWWSRRGNSGQEGLREKSDAVRVEREK